MNGFDFNLPGITAQHIGIHFNALLLQLERGTMAAQIRSISWRGTPFDLSGNDVKVGDPAPDCELVANDLSLVRLSSYQGKILIISALPSLDTPTCDTETRKFNDMAANVHPDTVILTVSMDLPFAQKRWCGAAGIDKVVTLSDHLKGEFGNAYGVMIAPRRLLARAVFLVDREGIVRHKEIVNELASEPDYDAILKKLEEVV
jgi:thiol peroxidase